MVEFEKSLQAASDFLFFAFSVRLVAELARRSSESRHFDQKKKVGFIPAFSVPNNLHQRKEPP
jgi:hypothetical protein